MLKKMLLFTSLGVLLFAPAALPAQQPWETAGGEACFERWIADTEARLNRVDGDRSHNNRKPWHFNQYGLIVGQGGHSVGPPDNWMQKGGNRHAYMWDIGEYTQVGITWPNWSLAGVQPLRPYIYSCVGGGGGGGGGQGPTTVSCDEYARTAVAQTSTYQANRCRGGQPNWWSTDYNRHRNWCLGNPRNPAPSAGTAMRQSVLDQCLAGGGGGGGGGQGPTTVSCDEYARAAVAQANTYQANRCRGGQPNWWSADYNRHRNWCLGNPRNPAPSAGTAMRQSVLDQCLAGGSGGGGGGAEWIKRRYLGCYKDSSARDLSGHSVSDSIGMTTERCIAICAEEKFSYAATQFARACFCDDDFGNYGPATNCDMSCTGNSAQICGGRWANSVYTTGVRR